MLTSDTLSSLLIQCARTEQQVKEVLLGINWTVLEVEGVRSGVGLCFSPANIPRNLPWSGSLAGRSLEALSRWYASHDHCEAVIGLAAVNAAINNSDNVLLKEALPLKVNSHFHLAVFEYFSPLLADAKVVIIGRYPELNIFQSSFKFSCIERRPGPNDLPESAAKTELPKADWVFITASSIANKTLPELLSCCQQAKVVLMGPSMPWLPEWADFGVDYLAGVEVLDKVRLKQVVAEAGGTRIFQESVRYRVLSL